MSLFESYPQTVRLRGFDQELCLPSQCQQIRISGDQKTRFSALSQIQKRLIIRISARQRAFFPDFHNFAIWEIVGQ